jgi:competence ComEA-like helix-hairpin-helix protein
MLRQESIRRMFGLVLVGALLASSALALQDKSKKPPPPSKPIDINTATFDQLHSLPGVGPVTAQAILDYRKKSGPFTRVEDLLAVKGISAGKLEKIKPYVMVKTPVPVSAKTNPPPKKP